MPTPLAALLSLCVTQLRPADLLIRITTSRREPPNNSPGDASWCALGFGCCRYKAMQQAAITLQAACRGRQARASLQQMHRAAVALQAAYRGWRVRQAIAESIPFVVKLQAYFRAGRQRAAFLRMRAAAVVLQAAIRGQQERHR